MAHRADALETAMSVARTMTDPVEPPIAVAQAAAELITQITAAVLVEPATVAILPEESTTLTTVAAVAEPATPATQIAESTTRAAAAAGQIHQAPAQAATAVAAQVRAADKNDTP